MSQCNNTSMNGKNEHGEENNLVEGVFYPAADYWHDLLGFEGYRRELEIDINTGKERSILHPTLPNRETIYGKEGESLPDLMCRTLRHAGLAFDRAGTNFDGDFTLDSLYDLGLELLSKRAAHRNFDKGSSEGGIDK